MISTLRSAYGMTSYRVHARYSPPGACWLGGLWILWMNFRYQEARGIYKMSCARWALHYTLSEVSAISG